MSKIVYAPGTGTIIDANEVLILDTRDLLDEGYDEVEETLANVDVKGINLGALLDAVAQITFINHGVTVSQFEARA